MNWIVRITIGPLQLVYPITISISTRATEIVIVAHGWARAIRQKITIIWVVRVEQFHLLGGPYFPAPSSPLFAPFLWFTAHPNSIFHPNSIPFLFTSSHFHFSPEISLNFLFPHPKSVSHPNSVPFLFSSYQFYFSSKFRYIFLFPHPNSMSHPTAILFLRTHPNSVSMSSQISKRNPPSFPLAVLLTKGATSFVATTRGLSIISVFNVITDVFFCSLNQLLFVFLFSYLLLLNHSFFYFMLLSLRFLAIFNSEMEGTKRRRQGSTSKERKW